MAATFVQYCSTFKWSVIMGIIGFDLYDNDVAFDVKNEFGDMIYKGISCSDATKNIICDFQEHLSDSDDCPIVWISLADTQWEMGILLKKVKKRAFKEIDKLITDAAYGDYEFRHIFFENIKEIKNKLNSPMPPKVKVERKIKNIYSSLWEQGDVYRLQLTTDVLQYESIKFLKDRWLMLQVINIVEIKEKSCLYYCPIMVARISKDSIMPNLSQLAELEPIVVSGGSYQGFGYRFCVKNLTENNIKDYQYCGKGSLLLPDCESITNIENTIHFNIENLANELAWYYYYLKKELGY